MNRKKILIIATILSIFLLILFSCIEEPTDPNHPPLKNSENLYIYTLNAEEASMNRTESIDFDCDLFDILLQIDDYSDGSGVIELYSGDTLLFSQSLDTNQVLEVSNIIGYIPTSISINLYKYTGNISLVISGQKLDEIVLNSPSTLNKENIFVYTLHAEEYTDDNDYILNFDQDSIEVFLQIANYYYGTGIVIITDENGDSLFSDSLNAEKIITTSLTSENFAQRCTISTEYFSGDLTLIVRTKEIPPVSPPVISNSPTEINDTNLYMYTMHAQEYTDIYPILLDFNTDSVKISLKVNNCLSGELVISFRANDNTTLFAMNINNTYQLDSILSLIDIPGWIYLQYSNFSGDISLVVNGFELPQTNILDISNLTDSLYIGMEQSSHFYLNTSLNLDFTIDSLSREVVITNYTSGYCIIAILDSNQSEVFTHDSLYSDINWIHDPLSTNGEIPQHARVKFHDFSGTFRYILRQSE